MSASLGLALTPALGDPITSSSLRVRLFTPDSLHVCYSPALRANKLIRFPEHIVPAFYL